MHRFLFPTLLAACGSGAEAPSSPDPGGSAASEKAAPAAPPASEPPAASGTGADVHPVLDLSMGGVVLGASSGKAWLDAQQAGPRVRGGESYRLYALDGARGRATGTPGETVELCEWNVVQDLAPAPPEGGHLLAVGGDWDAMPRPVKQQSGQSDTYVRATAEVLKGLGLEVEKPQVMGLLRVDLDGDGTEEVLVSASDHGTEPSFMATPGSYAVVYLRHLHNGEVRTHVVASQIIEEDGPAVPPIVVEVVGVLDVNGDGVMEVAVNTRYYEGTTTTLYSLVDGEPIRRFSGGCGA